MFIICKLNLFKKLTKSSHFIWLEIESDNMRTQKITEKEKIRVDSLVYTWSLYKRMEPFTESQSLLFVNWHITCSNKLIVQKQKI